MRIVTWNCQMALHRKIDPLLSLNADVAVIPECSEKSVIACGQYRFNTLWFGSNPRKGLGIICREDWLIRPLPQPEQKWIVPLHVGSPVPFTLIAVWACAAGVRREDRYIRQVYLALTAHPEWFDGEAVIVAGDFNSNKIWDRKRRVGNHSDVVKLLGSHGLVSAYHEHRNEAHGAETCPTFHLFRHKDKPYHIDYIFLPQAWKSRLEGVEVCKYEDWSKMSDHCPLFLDVS